MKKIALVLLYSSVFVLIIYYITHVIGVAADLKKGLLIKDTYILASHYNLKFTTINFQCKIIVNGQQKIVSSSSSISYHTARHLVNHYIPAMYSRKYDRLDLLILPKDFKEYGLPYPDSLRWIDSLNSRY